MSVICEGSRSSPGESWPCHNGSNPVARHHLSLSTVSSRHGLQIRKASASGLDIEAVHAMCDACTRVVLRLKQRYVALRLLVVDLLR